MRGEAHPRFVHGLSNTSEHGIWSSAKQRCFNPKHEEYENYGARGIIMCPEWRSSFVAFFEYIGPRPSPNHTLDRIKNERGYVPGNVRWALSEVQQRNKRTSKLTLDQVEEVRAMAKSRSRSHEEIAAIYNISKHYVAWLHYDTDKKRRAKLLKANAPS